MVKTNGYTGYVKASDESWDTLAATDAYKIGALKAQKFMDMVWKSHTKVSFGYWQLETDTTDFKTYGVIWYCPYKTSTLGPNAYAAHSKADSTATLLFVGD
jgi:hypothetical protein